MSRLSHENVAKMVGYCKESDPFSRMLVFQYPPNGTLYEHLHGKPTSSCLAPCLHIWWHEHGALSVCRWRWVAAILA